MFITKAVKYMFVSTFCFTIMQSLIKAMPQFHSFRAYLFQVFDWLVFVSWFSDKKRGFLNRKK